MRVDLSRVYNYFSSVPSLSSSEQQAPSKAVYIPCLPTSSIVLAFRSIAVITLGVALAAAILYLFRQVHVSTSKSPVRAKEPVPRPLNPPINRAPQPIEFALTAVDRSLLQELAAAVPEEPFALDRWTSKMQLGNHIQPYPLLDQFFYALVQATPSHALIQKIQQEKSTIIDAVLATFHGEKLLNEGIQGQKGQLARRFDMKLTELATEVRPAESNEQFVQHLAIVSDSDRSPIIKDFLVRLQELSPAGFAAEVKALAKILPQDQNTALLDLVKEYFTTKTERVEAVSDLLVILKAVNEVCQDLKTSQALPTDEILSRLLGQAIAKMLSSPTVFSLAELVQLKQEIGFLDHAHQQKILTSTILSTLQSPAGDAENILSFLQHLADFDNLDPDLIPVIVCTLFRIRQQPHDRVTAIQAVAQLLPSISRALQMHGAVELLTCFKNNYIRTNVFNARELNICLRHVELIFPADSTSEEQEESREQFDWIVGMVKTNAQLHLPDLTALRAQFDCVKVLLGSNSDLVIENATENDEALAWQAQLEEFEGSRS